MENRRVQEVQLRSQWCADQWRGSASITEGSRRVQKYFLGNGVSPLHSHRVSIPQSARQDSPKCRLHHTWSLRSGVSIPCSYRSNIQHATFKTRFTSRVSTFALLTSTSLNLVAVTDPSTSLPPPKDYYDRVAKVHEFGGYGSIGYRAPWSEEESRKLLLRTHTTASSAHLLRTIATQPGGFKPAKLFSIDRVFRNEATDATHLAEFHQVEGVVADRNLTLADLLGEAVRLLSRCKVILTKFQGFMKTFFSKMGIHNLRFKPAYNPYTEVSSYPYPPPALSL